MLYCALVLLVIALIAAILGFAGIAASAAADTAGRKRLARAMLRAHGAPLRAPPQA